MKVRLIGIVVLQMFLSCGLVMAQAQATSNAASAAASNPVVDTIRQMEDRQSKNLIAAAEEMPADKYAYKPTPEQMSFAHLMVHVADSNNALCSALGPEKQQVKFDGTEPKDTLVRDLRDSFDFCRKVLDRATDANLSDTVTLFEGHTGTRARALIMMASGWADHYGAAAMYLRLNGLLPPTAKKQ